LADNAGKRGLEALRFAIKMTWLMGPEICAAHIELLEAKFDMIFVPDFPDGLSVSTTAGAWRPK
jgi:hypothetical protein